MAFYIDDIWISAWLSRRGVKQICYSGVGHDAQCVSAATDCVAKQDPRPSETQQ